METINNKIRRAVKGDIDAVQFINKHYLYIGDKFYKENKNIVTKGELYLVITESISEYCNLETNIPLILYIYKKIYKLLQDKKGPAFNVRENILLACQGDLNARNNLVKHYSIIVTEKAKDYDYMEYDDLVQFGMVKLIEYIDILIREHKDSEFLTNGIARAIDIYFDRTLRNAVIQWNTPLKYMNDDLDNFILQYEFKEVIDSYTENEVKREIIKKYFLDRNTFKELGKTFNMSHESVRKIVKAAGPHLRSNYLK